MADEMFPMEQPQPPVDPQVQVDLDNQAHAERKRDIQRWLAKIKGSETYRKSISKEFRWRQIIDEYKGKFQLSESGGDIYIPSLNLVFAYVKTEIPALALRDPRIKVNPKKASTVQSSIIVEQALNYLWRHKRIKRENKKNIQDGKLVGHSWFKAGYTGKFGTVEDANGNTFEFIDSEDFFGYRIPFEQITFNPDATDPPYDCTWIAHEVWAPLDDVKKNSEFANTERLQPSSQQSLSRNSSIDPIIDAQPTDKEVLMCRMYEVWDKKSQRVFVISDGIDDYLKAPQPWPYEMRGFPFSFLCFNPAPELPYGIPDVYTFEPQLMEFMKIRAMQFDHIKRFNRQLLTIPNNFNDEQKSNLQLGIAGALIECNEPDKVFPLPYPPLQTDIYAIEDRLKEDMINISGQSPQERGATQKTTTRTFRELAQIQKGAENRRSEQIDTVEDFIEDIAYNLVALLQQFADVPYYVRITGEDPQSILAALSGRPSESQPGSVATNQGFTFTKEDIQGEFDIEVVAGSTAPLDRENKMAKVISLLEYLPALGAMPGGPVVGQIGLELAQELDMPAVLQAIKQEAQMQAENKEAEAQQAQQAAQMQTAQVAAQTQLQAEELANKQNKTVIDAMKVLQPAELGKEKKEPVSEAK